MVTGWYITNDKLSNDKVEYYNLATVSDLG